MTTFTERDRRAVKLGAFVLLVAFGGVRGLPALVRALDSMRGDLVLERRTLADVRSLVAATPAMRDSLVARRHRLAMNSAAAIIAPDPTGAASALGALVTGAARDVNVSVSALRLRPDSAGAHGFSRPRVAVEARGDVSGLMQLLLLIEGGTLLMTVTELAITQSDPLGAGRAEELAMSLVVEGLARMDSTLTRSRR